MSVLISNARVLTLARGERPRRGTELGVLAVIDGASVLVESGRIARVFRPEGPPAGAGGSVERVIDARGRVLMPAFVDCHTHTCWAGDRLDEWEIKKQGATYLELLEAGGGIMSTVRAVRSASADELVSTLLARLERMMRHGTTVVEIKSGYGLDTETELKMLGAIRTAGQRWAGKVIPTACIGHALDPDMGHEAFVAHTIDETLRAVHDEFPGIAIDAYCEKGAWSLDDCVRLFERAMELGHQCRVHADQFNALGMTPAAVRLGLRSVDHLESSRPHE
ncbi:MAG: amidohydrolase family protein, partial [Planctomycetes bacterium]|nr:amidohydrolase family protein [Planctomycetota bacterium]